MSRKFDEKEVALIFQQATELDIPVEGQRETYSPSDLRGGLDLQELKDVGVPEGVMIEYKREIYGNSDSNKKEFMKDVSSFANTSGGHLIIGISEKGGIASGLKPIAQIDPDRELQRLESLARDGIEPRIVGIRMKAIQTSTGGYIFVIRIPKSWNPPHRVSAKGHNKYYKRTSAGAYEVSVDELRVLFTSAATIQDRVRAFRAGQGGRHCQFHAAGAGPLRLACLPGRRGEDAQCV